MPEHIPYIRVFISSPGDVSAERKIALDVIEFFPNRPAYRGKVAFRVVAWDKPGAGTAMLATLTPQEAINRGLPKPSECDIVIVIFWSRMGTPFTNTDGKDYLSGTHWELLDALNSPRCETMIFRRTEAPTIDASDPHHKGKLEQYDKVDAFFRSDMFYRPDGSIVRGVNQYKTPDDFRRDFEIFFEERVVRLLEDYYKGEADTPPANAKYSQNGATMVDRVEQIWINDYLFSALNKLEPLEINLERRQPYKPDDQDRRIYSLNEIESLFARESLLILGEPGSGKTIVLLQLCRLLIKKIRTTQSFDRGLPVIFTLSSWAIEKLPIKKWVIKELISRYFLDEDVAEELVEMERIHLLLDGLDEVPKEARAQCLAEITRFLGATQPQKRNIGFVICCRQAEWEELEPKISIKDQAIILPLNDEQIKGFLTKNRNDTLSGIISHTSTSALLEDFSRSPFMLNTMAAVTQGKDIDFILDDITTLSEPELRDYFLESYINIRLQNSRNPRYRDFAKTRQRLNWLAVKMVQHNLVDFFLEDIQPNWHRRNLEETAIAWFTASASLGVMAVGTLTSLPPESPLRILLSPLTVIIGIVSVTAGLMSWILSNKRLIMIDKVRLRFNFWRRFRACVKWGLIIGGIIGVITIVNDLNSSSEPNDLSQNLRGGVFSFIQILGIAAIAGVIMGIIPIAETYEIKSPSLKPGQRLQISFRNSLLVGAAFASIPFLIWLVLFFIVQALPSTEPPELDVSIVLGTGLFCALPIWIGVALRYGLGMILRHYTHRLALSMEGDIPFWRYDLFLEYCANAMILRRVGGGYRFIHEYLRQYMARSHIEIEPTVGTSQESSVAEI